MGDFGSTFGGTNLESRSQLEWFQRELMPQFLDYFKGQVGKESPGVSDLDALFRGEDAQFNQNTGKFYKEAFLTPSINEFNETVRPGIESAFANIGGTLSSRRGQTIASGLMGTQKAAQANFAQQLPNLVNTRMQGIGQREALRFLPTQQALAFALTPTRAVQGAGGGNAGGEALGALGTGIGAYAALV